jgi:hypothetical protein
MKARGHGYDKANPPDVLFEMAAQGGRRATGYAVVGDDTGIDEIVILDGGTGYTQDPATPYTVTIDAPTGSDPVPATAEVILVP